MDNQAEISRDVSQQWGDILPGTVFWQEAESPINQSLLDNIKHARELKAAELVLLRRQMKRHEYALAVYEFRAYPHKLAALKRKIQQLKRDNPTDDRLPIWINRLRTMQRQPPAPPAPPKRNLVQRLFGWLVRDEPPLVITKEADAKQSRLFLAEGQARLNEHETALKNQRIYDELAAEMKLEVGYFGQQLVKRWSALGFKHETYNKDKKIIHRVKFAAAFYSPDEIQYQILVSTRNILGVVQHHLPDNVAAWNLVKPETLSELSAACERPVSSPHYENTSESFENGAYVTVYREGLTDGLFDVVDYDKVMSKYESSDQAFYPVPVGVKRGRVVQWLYLAEQPHLMINGISGSGKTNWIRVLIATLIKHHRPADFRLFIVDLKRGGDFRMFADVPHLADRIITRIDELSVLVPQLVAIMHQRMDLFARAYVHDIEDYNQTRNDPADRLPRIAIIIDECGAINDLADDKKDRDIIWRGLTLIATQARAAGIHLTLGTQQSFSDSIPKSVRDNITFVLSGRQRTLAGSLATFGTGKAKTLPAIRGRMYCDDGSGEPFQVQTPYLSKEDIQTAVSVASNYGERQPLNLPDGSETAEQIIAPPPEFTLTDLVKLSVEKLDGSLNYKLIYQLGVPVSIRTVREMIVKVVNLGQFEYQGVTYFVAKNTKGRGHILTLGTHSAIAHISNGVPTNDPTMVYPEIELEAI